MQKSSIECTMIEMAKKEQAKYNSINFLKPVLEPKDIWEKSYDWVMSIGRYVLVAVEIVVLVAFFARFTMDRQRNDLDDDIKSKIENILGTQAFMQKEAKYRLYHKFFAELDDMSSSQARNSVLIKEILENFPSEFDLHSFNFNTKSINFVFRARNYADIAKYTSYLNSNYDNVIIVLSRRGDLTTVTYKGDEFLENNTNLSGSDIDVNITFNLKGNKI